MDIITVNVGQGSLAIVRHNGEAIIVDARIPPSGDDKVENVKSILASFLKGFYLRGLILTGFDDDHADATGVGLVLRKYRPDWVMYPKYYKDTTEATTVFKIIADQERERAGTTNPLLRKSVRLDKLESRILTGLTDNFELQLFSPHIEDMDSSNNSSIVLRLKGLGLGGFCYLITGDTENDRWKTINKLFGNAMKSDVMAAPHHGSRNGANAKTLMLVAPDTILISAGVDNQYGHPDSQAVAAYSRVSKVYGTHANGGVSLLTSVSSNTLVTVPIK